MNNGAFYTILVRDKDGDKVGLAHPIKGLRFGKRLNNYGTAEFSIKVNDPMAGNLIDLRKNYIDIFRTVPQGIGYLLQENADFLLQESGDKLVLERSGTKVWSGEMAVTRALLESNGNNWATVECYTWFEQLYHRFTEFFERYQNIHAGRVLEGLLATTQAKTDGDFGGIVGKIDPTFLVDIVYNNENIAEAFTSLSEKGFDFEFDNDRVLNVSPVLGEDKTNSVVFQYGHNVSRVQIVEDFVSPANQAIVLGEVVTEDDLQRVERTDTDLRSEYGLRQTRLQQMEPAITEIFEDKGDAAIRKYGTPLIKVDFDVVRNITPSIDQFDVGDGVRLIVKDGMYNIDEEYRVFEWQMEVGTDNSERLSLVLGKFTI